MELACYTPRWWDAALAIRRIGRVRSSTAPMPEVRGWSPSVTTPQRGWPVLRRPQLRENLCLGLSQMISDYRRLVAVLLRPVIRPIPADGYRRTRRKVGGFVVSGALGPSVGLTRPNFDNDEPSATPTGWRACVPRRNC